MGLVQRSEQIHWGLAAYIVSVVSWCGGLVIVGLSGFQVSDLGNRSQGRPVDLSIFRIPTSPTLNPTTRIRV